MIRPFTVVCMLMAVGSGLYLYQCKHHAQVLDRQIASTIKETDQARNRIGMLRAEWAQLNEPERVAELARAHTTLQTAKPTQFMALNDLAAKLPAVVVPTRPSQPSDATDDPESAPLPVAQAEPRPARVAAAAPEPKPDAKPEVKPVAHAAADPKPSRPAVATPAPAVPPPPVAAPQVASVHPVARPLPPPHAPAASAIPVSAEATAPGTVGAAVLRAMRAREAQAAPYVQPVAAPAPTYAPPVHVPAAAPAAVPPSYTPQAYAAPASSMLGGSRTSLPPPVPFAAR